MKLQEKLNELFNEAKQNLETAKSQLNSTVNEVVDAAKEEAKVQKANFTSYKERLDQLRAKGFKRDEIVNDVKGELSFFSNEISSTFNRNIDKLKSIVTPKINEFKKATQKASAKVEKEVKSQATKAKKATAKATAKAEEVVEKAKAEVSK